MKKTGVIIQDLYEDTEKVHAPNPEDTSDGNWSPTIRKSWPYFIMGVCRMWLAQIEEIEGTIPLKKRRSSLRALLESYRHINESIKTLWREQGYHSMLHHLNAIYGYEPVLVREVNLRRF
jgi:hypothetical protein